MKNGRLHHVTVMSTDLDRSVEFYRRALGLRQVERPPFPNAGAWLATDGFMIHVNLNPGGTFRRRQIIDSDDVHFAIRVDDFEGAVSHLARAGYRETDDESDPLRMIVKRSGLAGFPQAYLMDRDGHVIEINAAR